MCSGIDLPMLYDIQATAHPPAIRTGQGSVCHLAALRQDIKVKYCPRGTGSTKMLLTWGFVRAMQETLFTLTVGPFKSLVMLCINDHQEHI